MKFTNFTATIKFFAITNLCGCTLHSFEVKNGILAKNHLATHAVQALQGSLGKGARKPNIIFLDHQTWLSTKSFEAFGGDNSFNLKGGISLPFGLLNAIDWCISFDGFNKQAIFSKRLASGKSYLNWGWSQGNWVLNFSKMDTRFIKSLKTLALAANSLPENLKFQSSQAKDLKENEESGQASLTENLLEFFFSTQEAPSAVSNGSNGSFVQHTIAFPFSALEGTREQIGKHRFFEVAALLQNLFKIHSFTLLDPLVAEAITENGYFLQFLPFNKAFAKELLKGALKEEKKEEDSAFLEYLQKATKTLFGEPLITDFGEAGNTLNPEAFVEAPKLSASSELNEALYLLNFISLFRFIRPEVDEQNCFESIKSDFEKGKLSQPQFKKDVIFLPLSQNFAEKTEKEFKSALLKLQCQLESLGEACSTQLEDFLVGFYKPIRRAAQLQSKRNAEAALNASQLFLRKFYAGQNEPFSLLSENIEKVRSNRLFACFKRENPSILPALQENRDAEALTTHFLELAIQQSSASSSCSQRDLQGTTQSGSATPALEASAEAVEELNESLSFTKLRDKEVDGLYSLPSSPLDSKSSAKKKEEE